MDLKVLECYKDFFEFTGRLVFLKGSAGSGKSYAVNSKILIRVLTQPKCNWLVVRRNYSDLKESVYADLVAIAGHLGVSHLFEFKKSPLEIKCKINSNRIVFKGMDDPEKIKSISGIHNIFIEEATQIENYTDYLQLTARVREPGSDYNQIICAFNPISSNHWIKTQIWDKIDSFRHGDIYVLSTTFLDNKFLPEETKEFFQNAFAKDPVFAQVYMEGKWPIANSSDRMYYSFGTNSIIDCFNSINESRDLHMAFDFNVHPGGICIASYWDEEQQKLTVVDELFVPGPSNTEIVIKECIRKWGSIKRKWFIYGDFSGNARKTSATQTDYQIIEANLKEADIDYVLRVNKSNPGVSVSARFVNKLFADCSIQIHSGCPNFISDLENAKMNSSGDKLIEYQIVNGVRCEAWHHWGDALRYIVCKLWAVEFQKFSGTSWKANYGLLNTSASPLFGSGFSEFNNNRF